MSTSTAASVCLEFRPTDIIFILILTLVNSEKGHQRVNYLIAEQIGDVGAI